MAHKKMELDAEPHVFEVGEYVFKFPTYLVSKNILGPYKRLIDASGGAAEQFDPTDPKNFERTVAVNETIFEVMSEMLLPESRDEFNAADLPDFVVAEMFRWIMGVYGENRPTGPSSDSSESSAGNGAASTASLRSKARRTRSTGASRAS